MIKIYFDGVLINPNYIRRLSQSSVLLTDTFKLGATLCRTVELDVDRAGVSSHPSSIIIKEDDTTLFTLQVDNVDEENKQYYAYTLADGMVNLNAVYDWSVLDNPTVENILAGICGELLNGTAAPTPALYSDLLVNWSQDTPARDFVSYVAELNGCFARISATGALEFVPFGTNTYYIPLEFCQDFKLGEKHTIDRVAVELGTATQAFPVNKGEGDTLYLNPSNILLSDSGNYTIAGMVEGVFNLINGYTYYSLSTSRTLFDPSILPGDHLVFIDGVNTYQTIAQVEWDYNRGWVGGFTTELNSTKQEETKVDTIKQIRKSINITVDRELNEIRQTVSDVEDDLSSQVSEVVQTAEGLAIKVSNTAQEVSNTSDRITTLETAVEVAADGVKISQGTEGSYTQITDQGMNIYVNDSKVAWASADGFNATEFIIDGWHIKTANNGNSLNFTRK